MIAASVLARLQWDEQLAQVRTELRSNNRTLSEEQIDLLAALVMEIRNTRLRINARMRVNDHSANSDLLGSRSPV